jgi:hypothetical protein
MEVPVVVNSGVLPAGCSNVLAGTHVPFAKAKLDSLYPTHDDYVNKVKAAANEAVAAGFLLPEDAQDVIDNANASIYGRQLNCGPLCTDVGLFPQGPSILLLRWHIYLYYLPDRATLLAPVDAAAIAIASGYNTADPATAKMFFSQAIALLQQYSTLIQGEATNGTLSQEAATYLSGQASQLISELQKL